MPKIQSVGLVEGREVADYVHCCHCQRAWPVRSVMEAHLRGDKKLGWCGKCARPCCPACEATCTPVEQMLSNIEAGLDPLAPRPAFSFIPRTVEG